MEYLIAIILVIALTLGAFNLYKLGQIKGYESGYKDASDYAINLMERKSNGEKMER